MQLFQLHFLNFSFLLFKRNVARILKIENKRKCKISKLSFVFFYHEKNKTKKSKLIARLESFQNL